MHSRNPVRSTIGMLVLGVLALLGGCAGEDSERELIAMARGSLAASQQQAAIAQLKAALQRSPRSAEARFLLADVLLDQGNAAEAVVELERAKELKLRVDDVAPRLARAMLANGQAKQVIERYGNHALTDPKAAAELKAAVGWAFATQGMAAHATQAVAAALVLDGRNAQARLLKARLQARSGAFDDALAIVNQVLAEDPRQADALVLLGQLFWHGKADQEQASKFFEQALAVNARSSATHMALVTMALQSGDVAAVKARVEAMQKALPGLPETDFCLAQVALLDFNHARARELAQRLLKFAPDNPRVLHLAGVVEAASGSLVLAQTYLGRALQYAPGLASARRLLAETHLRTQQPERAVAALTPLIDTDQPDVGALVISAAAHRERGRLAEAEAALDTAAQLDPANSEVKLARALSQIARGRVAEGFTALEALARADSGTEADLALITAHLRRNELDAALDGVERLRAKLNGSPLPDQLRGRILAQRRDFAAARASFERALGIDPANFPAAAGLAAIEIEQGRPAEALKRYEALLERDPKNARALTAVADLRRQSGENAVSIAATLREAVQANPRDPEPHLALVHHRLAEGDAKGAREAAHAAMSAVPDDPRLLEVHGRALLAAGDSEQAIAAFRKLAALQPTLAAPQMRLAEAYVQSGEPSAAEQALRRAKSIAPDLMAAYRQLATMAIAGRRASEALALAREAQRHRPSDPDPHRLEAEIHQGERHWDAAIEAELRALALDRSATGAGRLHALYVSAGRVSDADRFAASWERERPRDAGFQAHLGRLAIERNDFAAAETRYRQVLALQPDDANAMNNLAWSMLRQGKPGAVALAERANSLLPKSADVMDTLAMALAQEKQRDKALEWQRRAVELAPQGAELRLNLVRLLLEQGDKAAARAELDRLLRLEDKFASRPEVAAMLKATQ